MAKMASVTGKRWPVVGVRLVSEFPYIEAEVGGGQGTSCARRSASHRFIPPLTVTYGYVSKRTRLPTSAVRLPAFPKA